MVQCVVRDLSELHCSVTFLQTWSSTYLILKAKFSSVSAGSNFSCIYEGVLAVKSTYKQTLHNDAFAHLISDSEFCWQPMACLENFCSNRCPFSDKMYEKWPPTNFYKCSAFGNWLIRVHIIHVWCYETVAVFLFVDLSNSVIDKLYASGISWKFSQWLIVFILYINQHCHAISWINILYLHKLGIFSLWFIWLESI